MTGHGEVKAAPDMATVNAGVTTAAPTAAAALSADNARMNQMFDALRKMGIPDRDIQTSGFSVSPQYTNGEANNPRRLTGYQVSNEVSVRLDDVTQLGAALDTLVGAGTNQMNGVSFDIADARAVAGKGPYPGHCRRPDARPDLCQGGGSDAGPHRFHQRRRRRGAPPDVQIGAGCRHGFAGAGRGRRTKRRSRCHGGMGNPLTLYWSHDQPVL